MHLRSPRAAFWSITGAVSFSTASLSPVRELSLTFKEKFSSSRPSATTRSPASKKTTSPGTMSAESISTLAPSRRTLAFGEDMARRLSRDFSALTYCTVPKRAFKSRTAKMTMVLSRLPESIEITAAASRMKTSRSLNWLRNTAQTGFFLPSVSLLGPCFSRLASASRPVSPSFAVCRADRASSGVLSKNIMLFSRFLSVLFIVRGRRCQQKKTSRQHTTPAAVVEKSCYRKTGDRRAKPGSRGRMRLWRP